MDMVSKLKDFGTDQNGDSGFLSGFCTTESDLSAACQSDYQIGDMDSGVDISEHLSKLEIAKEEYPDWEYFFVPDADGDNQLHIGVMQGYFQAVSTLISLIPHPSVLDFQNNLNQTALHISVLTRQPRMTHLLVTCGARIDMQDSNGNTPLHLAAENGDVDCLQALVMGISSSKLADYAAESKNIMSNINGNANTNAIDLINYDGMAPVHLAAKGGHCDAIRALHWLGTNLNIGDGKGGRTPLHYAIVHDQILAAHCLINECGSGLEVETYSGFTPFELAKDCNNIILVQDLIGFGSVPYESMEDSELESDYDYDESEFGL